MGRDWDSYEAQQRARFMRPDAARYMRPDAGRFIRPDAARFLRPGSDPADVFPALDWKYSPNQRRVPAGKPGGGRWTREQETGGGGGGFGAGAPAMGDEFGGEDISFGSEYGDSEGFGGFGLDEEDFQGFDFGDTGNLRDPQPATDLAPDSGIPKINDHRVLSDTDPEEVIAGEQSAQAGGGRRGSGGPPSEMTPAQAARLSVAQARADGAINRVREVDPSWSPQPSIAQTTEGKIKQYEAEAAQAQARINELVAGRALPGLYAGESIPARGPDRDFTAAERREINRIGSETGCHSCGKTESGLPSGNFILDHQPPNILNSLGRPQRLYPQCLTCSSRQGPFVRDIR